MDKFDAVPVREVGSGGKRNHLTVAPNEMP